MWMSARPSLASVQEETVSTQWDPLNVNALLGTSSMRSHRNVKVRIKPGGVMVKLTFSVSLNDRVDKMLEFKT